MREPDRHAPRYRFKFKTILTPELIRKFKEKYPRYAQYDDKILMEFLKRHSLKISETIATTREGVELPEGIGTVFVAMVPASKKEHACIAYSQSMKLGITVKYSNHHTDGKLPKIVYCNFLTKYKLENRVIWSFKGVRNFTALVSKLAGEMHTKYINMVFYKKMWQELEDNKAKDEVLQSQKEDLKVYNEFE